MKLLVALTLFAVAGMAMAECPDACSGHGFCGEYDKCSCWRNWMGNSCADRVCPYDLAYVDLPLGDLNMDGARTDLMLEMAAHVNERVKHETWPNGIFYDAENDGHFYAECSNKGMCDRKSGLCQCFDGFEGTACRRTVCPNDCSGHGTCETMEEMAAAGGFAYTLWDRYKMQVCDCDPQYFGIDCSLLHCPYGDDPLTTKQHDEVQFLDVQALDAALAGTFRLTYVDEYGETWDTMPIAAQDFDWGTVGNNQNWADAVKSALQGIPNSVFESVQVEVSPVEQPLPGVYTKAVDGITWDASSTGTNNNLILANQDDFLTAAATNKVVSNCKANAAQAKVDITADGLTAEKLSCGDTAAFDDALCHSAKHGIRAVITFTSNPGNVNNLGCVKDSAFSAVNGASCASTDILTLTAACGEVQTGNKITANFDIEDFATTGDRIRCGSTVYTIDKVTVSSGDGDLNSEATVTETVAGDVAITAHNAPAFALYNVGDKELVECSHRGLCNYGEGLCECFNGYTNDDCGAQDALSA